MTGTKQYTVSELEELRDMAAVFVMRHGEVLLPIFERLEREVEAAKSQSAAMDRVRAICERLQRSSPEPKKPH
ncbi:MAG: hypothetical protein K0S00_3969 [Xanthobacteraceae bacterium]|nr:hypothetical protein [Xanthobacteraceae bacterium]